eukprot:6747_1
MNRVCTNVVFIERNLNTMCFSLGALSVIWFGYKFIKSKDIQMEAMKTKYRTYYRIGKLYFLLILLMLLTYIVYATYSCINPTVAALIRSLAATFYGIQHHILIFLLFYRLQLAFHDSAFQLTPYNIWLFRVFYTIYILSVSILVILVFTGDIDLYTPLGAMMMATTWILQFVLVIWITVIFTYKLRVISFNPHSQSEEDIFNAQMMFSTTKIALLTIFAITPNLVGTAIRVYAAVHPSSEMDFVNLLGIVFDVSTNFVAILLGFKSYETEYIKCCGCCHTKCFGCCVGNEYNVNRANHTVQRTQTDKTETDDAQWTQLSTLETHSKTTNYTTSAARVGSTATV